MEEIIDTSINIAENTIESGTQDPLEGDVLNSTVEVKDSVEDEDVSDSEEETEPEIESRRIDFISMGCSKNLVDAEKVMYQLKNGGHKIYHNPKRMHHDIAIVNTCGFIGDAKQESIDVILKLVEAKTKHRLNEVYVTGCLSERYKEELMEEIPEVDKYYGKFNYSELVNDIKPKYRGEEANHRLLTTPSHYAYLKIAEGCNRQCAYCAIPLITKDHISRPIGNILDEVRYLVGLGVKEFQLISQEITYYGLDLYGKRKIAELVERISDIKGVKWIRLHYGYPVRFPMDLLKVMRERENVCKYLDIAMQHISNKVLTNMLRNTTKAYQMDLIRQLREEVPGICLRTTLMTGFPGEGEEEFEELLEFVKWARFERMGAFTYSEEENTIAARKFKDEIPQEVKDERLAKLMAVQQTISEEIGQQRIGKTLKVIIDRKEGNHYIGRTEYDSPEVDGEVIIDTRGKRLRAGSFHMVKILDADEFDLYGNI